ncbi:DUF1232 domain-containing protein [Pseudomonas sp. PDM14]|uniref:YkvA family protein n=1 Tax=Pseudomonas sp. PDM14 TaxID=2769288 RepID=UPI001785D117|nr:YkvA family protein [Pseudomonas sp. PDM14]MBD9481983.1 DUF1232 domain-containing protein [Pseudomonas sp. PDM14]
MNIPRNLRRYLRPAQLLLARGRLPGLLLAVSRKGSGGGLQLGRLKGALQLLQGLCLAWWRGEYRAVSKQALLSVVAGLLYFLSPLDAVPDWLLGVGFLDDLAVLAWVVRTWRGELDAYQAWRAQRTPGELAVIERLPSADEPSAQHK